MTSSRPAIVASTSVPQCALTSACSPRPASKKRSAWLFSSFARWHWRWRRWGGSSRPSPSHWRSSSASPGSRRICFSGFARAVCAPKSGFDWSHHFCQVVLTRPYLLKSYVTEGRYLCSFLCLAIFLSVSFLGDQCHPRQRISCFQSHWSCAAAIAGSRALNCSRTSSLAYSASWLLLSEAFKPCICLKSLFLRVGLPCVRSIALVRQWLAIMDYFCGQDCMLRSVKVNWDCLCRMSSSMLNLFVGLQFTWAIRTSTVGRFWSAVLLGSQAHFTVPFLNYWAANASKATVVLVR